MRLTHLALVFALLAGCATLKQDALDERLGPAEPARFDSDSVVQGLVGEVPKTAWLTGYPLLERIYSLLVAGYDVWGNTPHQLETWLFMDYLHMEGEANVQMLLTKAAPRWRLAGLQPARESMSRTSAVARPAKAVARCQPALPLSP